MFQYALETMDGAIQAAGNPFGLAQQLGTARLRKVEVQPRQVREVGGAVA